MKSAPSKTTTTNEPTKAVRDQLPWLFSQAKAATQLPKYTGPVMAPVQPGQYSAANDMLNSLQPVADAGQMQVNLGEQWGQDLLAGRKDVPMLQNYDYAGLNTALDATARPMLERYTQELIPQFQQNMFAQGAGTNSRITELMPQQFATSLNRELSDSFARMSLEDINSIRESQPKYDAVQMSLAQMLPQLAQGGLAAPALQSQILAAIQGLDQQGLDAEMAKYGYQTEQALGPLERFANILYGSGGGTSTTSTTAGKGGLSGALQGGLGGAGMLGALGASFSNPFTLGGVALMALLGGLG